MKSVILNQISKLAIRLSIVILAVNLFNTSLVLAQSVTDTFTPLVPGALSSGPYIAPMAGPAPPMGSGFTPMPVTPGMTGSPTLPPSVLNTPANNIDVGNSNMTLSSFNPAATSAPGVLGPSLTGQIPGPVSTPGANPGSLTSDPINYGYNPSAVVVNVNSGGGLPNGSAPITGRGGQATRDFGLNKTGIGSLTTDFGQPLNANPNIAIQPQYSQDGPRAAQYPGQMDEINRAPNLPNAQPTISLFGSQILFKGSANPPLQTYAPY